MTATPADDDLVLAEHRGDVLLLTLNRPDRLNAWTDALERRYFGLLTAADADPDVRAIVVTGAGRGFCSGADLADLEATAGDVEAASAVERPPRSFPLTMRKPMIAAVNGAAVGLGLVEALYCDVRFAAPEAKLGTAFVQRGLIAEYGTAWLLPRLVGVANALDLLLSGRTVKGEEALALGLVNRLVAPEELVGEAVAYAQQLAGASSPTSMAVIKGQVWRSLDLPWAEALADADQLMADSFAAPDVTEGVTAFMERRPARFAPLGPRAQEAALR